MTRFGCGTTFCAAWSWPTSKVILRKKAALLTFVVAGGGFSGVETLGEMSEMVRRCISNFRNVDAKEVRFCLIHSRDVVLPEMARALGEAAGEVLRKRSVEMIMNARVRAATWHGVHLSTGQFLPTRTFVCTVGNAANPVVKDLLDRQRFVEGKLHGRGIAVFETDSALRCTGRPGYWAVGDNAGVPDPEDSDSLCPPTAQFAVREARICAQNILATIDARPLIAFHYRSMGMLASLGRRYAVAEILGVRFSGPLAWLAWRSVYWAKLPGLARKVTVMLDWTVDLLFPRDIAQTQGVSATGLKVHHYEAGELIIKAGEIGRELFIVLDGEVEILGPAGPGVAGPPVAVLRRGEVFGEKALLRDTRRGASARAAGAVDVLVMSRNDFVALKAQLPVLDDYFDTLMDERYGSALQQTPATPAGQSPQ